MKIPRSAIVTVVEAIDSGAKRATKFLNSQTIVRATRIGKYQKGDKGVSIVLTLGPMNAREHKIRKQRTRAGLEVKGYLKVQWPR